MIVTTASVTFPFVGSWQYLKDLVCHVYIIKIKWLSLLCVYFHGSFKSFTQAQSKVLLLVTVMCVLDLVKVTDFGLMLSPFKRDKYLLIIEVTQGTIHGHCVEPFSQNGHHGQRRGIDKNAAFFPSNSIAIIHWQWTAACESDWVLPVV